MNRSFVSVILGGFGVEEGTSVEKDKNKTVKTGSPEDAAFIMSNASSVIIVPGYGMAVAQAQHALREMCDILKKNGVTIKYAIHPVAGRMPFPRPLCRRKGSPPCFFLCASCLPVCFLPSCVPALL